MYRIKCTKVDKTKSITHTHAQVHNNQIGLYFSVCGGGPTPKWIVLNVFLLAEHTDLSLLFSRNWVHRTGVIWFFKRSFRASTLNFENIDHCLKHPCVTWVEPSNKRGVVVNGSDGKHASNVITVTDEGHDGLTWVVWLTPSFWLHFLLEVFFINGNSLNQKRT